MTSLIGIESDKVSDKFDTVCTTASNNNYYKERHKRHVLKSKENTYKHKCEKVLKRKLKKYRLRQNGEEDQDVIDVSKILVTTLRFSSPQKTDGATEDNDLEDLEYMRPKNYLFKMVRKQRDNRNSVTCLKFPTLQPSKQNENEVKSSVVLNSQEKKQTNAFKLLMDSRNKSIGSNSPGKEKNDAHVDCEDVVEKKTLKVKRNLALQKMAEAKGALKKKEIEEYHDKVIKKKMEKRAENLKNMILKNLNNVKGYDSAEKSSKEVNKEKQNLINSVEVTNSNTNKMLKIVDIFNTLDEAIIVSPVKKVSSEEDKEFLKKLSPSLKKKESMLSYFKKVNKEPEPSSEPENDNIIKVKLRKKKKHKKLSLKRDTLSTDSILETEERKNVDDDKVNDQNDNNNEDNITEKAINSEVIAVDESNTGKIERQKRKRINKNHENMKEIDSKIYISDGRPKRITKKPVKYTDDAIMSSSDDDMHIFTPKKKKLIENDKANVKTTLKSDSNTEVLTPKSVKKLKIVKEVKMPVKSIKLAPIFASKQIDQSALEAKQKFLQSGVPDKLKKIMHQHKTNNIIENNFPIVVHVQQIESNIEDCNSQFNIPELNVDEDVILPSYEDIFKKLLVFKNEEEFHNNDNIGLKKSTQTMLKHIKQLYPKFPVYRTYTYLRGLSKGELKDCNHLDLDNSIEIMNDLADIITDNPDRFSWTRKYKAFSAKQIIGNFESIKELKKWLVAWTENAMKSRSKNKADSDSSDYYQSDGDSRDSIKSMNNLLILTGPTGCGKTSSVYAVAADLAMKVIEVNASSRRTGKIMLQDLHEATQSHKVNRGAGNLENSQKSQERTKVETIKFRKRGRPKKTMDNMTKKQLAKAIVSSSTTSSSQESRQGRTDSSLILIDDADIVFEQDDGFSSAIVQLVQSSKRPVILITSSLQCPHLQKFLQSGKVLKLSPLLPRLLGTWLDIMCLADNGFCWPGIGAKFLNYFKGDIRKTINFLQFYLTTYMHNVPEQETTSQSVDNYKCNIDDENSNMSWADHEDLIYEVRKLPASNNIITEINPIWEVFINHNSNLVTLRHPIQLFNIWWSIPSLLGISFNISKLMVNKIPANNSETKRTNVDELEAISNVFDAVSLSDNISNQITSSCDISCGPWHSPELHSVSEQENTHYYHRSYEMSDEICHTMVISAVQTAQDILCSERKTDICFPGMSIDRERDRVISRHKNLTSFLNGSAALDRRALALDYWPTCRTICRVEKSRTDTNSKRNNRFCHYLKSLSVLCKTDTLDHLCDSLCTEGTNFA